MADGLSQTVVARKSKTRLSHRACPGIAQKQSGGKVVDPVQWFQTVINTQKVDYCVSA